MLYYSQYKQQLKKKIVIIVNICVYFNLVISFMNLFYMSTFIYIYMCVCVYFMLMLWFVPVFVICLCLHDKTFSYSSHSCITTTIILLNKKIQCMLAMKMNVDN